MMESLLLLLLLSTSSCSALHEEGLQAEISNGSFHHFFVPDGYYDDTEDLEQCQMLFRFSDARCGSSEVQEVQEVREQLVLVRLQAEEEARRLDGVARAVTRDLDGEKTYVQLLDRELVQVREAFTGVDSSLQELELKFKQSQESDLKEDLSGSVVQQARQVRLELRQTRDVSSALRDQHELLSLVIRSHGTRLSRLKTRVRL